MEYTIDNIPELTFSYGIDKYDVTKINRSKGTCHLSKHNDSWSDSSYDLRSVVRCLNEGSYMLVELINVKQEGVLPKKFYINRTPETAAVINKWFTEHTAIPRGSLYASLYYPVFRGADMAAAKKEGYVQITYEEFYKAINPEPIINNHYSIF